jgi:hypothetical protein
VPIYLNIADEIQANHGMLELGHVIVLTFHVTALCFGAPYLLITIPVHLLYTTVALAKQDGAVRRRDTNVLCAECKS